jgi:cytochrome c biogenesis protein CcmG/thiol:disulfide interchange protein DsbE
MKITNLSPLLIFAILFIFFTYKALAPTKNSLMTKPLNLKVELSQLISIFSNKPLKEPKQKYIINIFSSWCTHCRITHNELLHLAKYKNIKIIGIAWKDTKENINKMLQEEGNPYQDIAFADDQFILHLGIASIPETFIVNSDNIVEFKISGTISQGVLENGIYPAFK